MTITRTFQITAVSVILSASVGSAAGFLLGKFIPNYYRGVFPAGSKHPAFDPVSVGVGLGMSQGMIVGVLLGTAVVAIFAMRDAKSDIASASQTSPEPTGHPHSRPHKTLMIILALIACIVCLLISFLIGLTTGVISQDEFYYERHKLDLETALNKEPAFSQITMEHEYQDYISLHGTVPNPIAFNRLKSMVEHTLGERQAKMALRLVRVAGQTPPSTDSKP